MVGRLADSKGKPQSKGGGEGWLNPQKLASSSYCLLSLLFGSVRGAIRPCTLIKSLEARSRAMHFVDGLVFDGQLAREIKWGSFPGHVFSPIVSSVGSGGKETFLLEEYARGRS